MGDHRGNTKAIFKIDRQPRNMNISEMRKTGTKNTEKTASHKGFASCKEKDILETIGTSGKHIPETDSQDATNKGMGTLPNKDPQVKINPLKTSKWTPVLPEANPEITGCNETPVKSKRKRNRKTGKTQLPVNAAPAERTLLVNNNTQAAVLPTKAALIQQENARIPITVEHRPTTTEKTSKRMQEVTSKRMQERIIARLQKTCTIIRQEKDDLQEINQMIKDEELDPKIRKYIPKRYRIYTKLFQEELESVLPEHNQWDHAIELIDGKHPKFQQIYKLNEEELGILREMLDDNLRKGFIRPSTSSAGYPVMFVPKKNGKKRLVVDYRQLNDITKKDRTPLPLIPELQDRLHKAKWFTTLNLKGAYNLIRILKGDEWKTAFRTKFGLFEYMVMPFGLTNAPATFQRMINNVLREHIDHFVIAYLDDILIFSNTEEEHKEHVNKVLKLLKNNKLLVEPKKCKFHAQEVDFLGHVITPGEIRMQERLIAPIKDWKRPENVKDIQSFLGLANYYQQFVKDFGRTAIPLYELTRKDKKFEWLIRQQQAFDQLKKALTSRPVLRAFDPNKVVQLKTDASDFALGGQLSQPDENGIQHPVAFYSKKMDGAELNYPVYDKEFLAIVNCLKEWRHYCQGSKHTVEIYTDHKNISHFTTTQTLSGRQVRWAIALAEYDIKIIHTKGTENGRADALSRQSEYEVGKIVTEQQILKYDEQENIRLKHPYHTREINTLTKKTVNTSIPDVIKANMEFWKKEQIPAGIQMASGLPIIMETQKVWVPPNLHNTVAKMMHEHPNVGHLGITNTLEKLRRNYKFPKMKETVTQIIHNCVPCGQSKAARHLPYGLLQPLPVPPRPWHSISMDFITKLPASKDTRTDVTYDAILVIVDRLTKYGIFIPYQESTTANTFADLLEERVFNTYGWPKEIVSNRGQPFASHYWKTRAAQNGTKLKLSTAYHKETNGQTERVNQTLETYLRLYANYPQDNWVSLLSPTQMRYNTTVSASTKKTPALGLFGYEIRIAEAPIIEENPAPSGLMDHQKRKQLWDDLARNMLKAQENYKKYADKRRIEGPILKKGEMVYLNAKNIQTDRPSKKLDHKNLGPFKIVKEISLNNYELELPSALERHPIFHVSQLSKAPQDSEQQTDIASGNEQKEWEVKKVLSHKHENGEDRYLVKWKHFEELENTWEPIENLRNSRQLLRKYHQATRKRSQPLPDQGNSNR